MNGKRRFETALQGEKPDHIPVIVSNNNSFLCQYYGVPVERLLDSSELLGQLTARFVREFGFDMVRPSVGYIYYGCGPEIGVTWKFAEGQFPAPVEGCIKNEEDLERFKIPVEPSGYFKQCLDIHSMLVKEIGREVFIRGVPLGPFSSGCFLRGIETFLLDSAMNIKFFHLIMKKCVELSIYFMDQISMTGVDDMVLNEVFLTPGFLSPQFFQKEVEPYIQAALIKDSSISPFFYQQNFLSMSKLSDGTTQQGLASAIYYGTKESLDVIKESVNQDPIPGHPPLVSISGRSLVKTPLKDLMDFVRKGIDILAERGVCNPCIYLVSVQAESQKEALEIAAKIRAIQEFRENVKL